MNEQDTRNNKRHANNTNTSPNEITLASVMCDDNQISCKRSKYRKTKTKSTSKSKSNCSNDNDNNNSNDNDNDDSSNDQNTPVKSLLGITSMTLPDTVIMKSNTSVTISNHNTANALDNSSLSSDTYVDSFSKRVWTALEDKILHDARKMKYKCWATEAQKLLTDRSVYAIRSRWKRHILRMKDNDKAREDSVDKSTTTQVSDDQDNSNQVQETKRVKIMFRRWSEEEDNIILTEYNEDPKRWVAEAFKRLPGRSRDSIRGRWRDLLKHSNMHNDNDYKHVNNDDQKHTTKIPWSNAEDLAVICEYDRDPKTFLSRCILALPRRSERSIQDRWRNVLKQRYTHMLTTIEEVT